MFDAAWQSAETEGEQLHEDCPSGVVFTYSRPEQPFLRRMTVRAVERLSGRARIERLYHQWRAKPRDPSEPVFTAGVKALRLQADLAPGSLQNLPATGGDLIVANHPLGIADGLLLGHLASLNRTDVKLLGHSLLCQPPEARKIMLPIDFGEGLMAKRTSAISRKAASDWLDQGHVLIIFPAGCVSTTPRPFGPQAVDAAWHPFVARLASRPFVQTVPVFVGGQNSRLFHLASHYSYPLRVALIFFETNRWMGRRIKVAIGRPVRAVDLGEKAGITARLRALTYALAGPDGPPAEAVFQWPRWIRF